MYKLTELKCNKMCTNKFYRKSSNKLQILIRMASQFQNKVHKHILCEMSGCCHVQGMHHWKGHKVNFPGDVHAKEVETNFSSGVTLYGKRKSNILVFRKDSFSLAENRQARTTHPTVLSSCFIWKTYCDI